MSATKWEPHYTGIETCSIRLGLFELYRSRDARTKRLSFARISNAYAYRRFFAPSFHVGAFIGRTNYGGHGAGFEIFAGSIAAGMTRDPQWGVRWSGSMRDPRRSYILHFGRLFVASRTDGWLKRIIERRDEREWARQAAAYDVLFDLDAQKEESEA